MKATVTTAKKVLKLGDADLDREALEIALNAATEVVESRIKLAHPADGEYAAAVAVAIILLAGEIYDNPALLTDRQLHENPVLDRLLAAFLTPRVY